MRGSAYCPAHHPDYKERRRAGARKGGRAKGVPEVRKLKNQVRVVIGGVLAGKIEKSVGSVALQGYNVLLRATELERRLRETEELERRLEAVEETLARRGGRYGAV